MIEYTTAEIKEKFGLSKKSRLSRNVKTKEKITKIARNRWIIKPEYSGIVRTGWIRCTAVNPERGCRCVAGNNHPFLHLGIIGKERVTW